MQRFGAPLPNPAAALPTSKPRPYKPGLTPAHSLLRPHCTAKQRLLLWLPSLTSPRATRTETRGRPLQEKEYDRILSVIDSGWAPPTKELYGTGLLVFHVFCDLHNIPDEQRAPLDTNTLSLFLANCAGSYSGSTISNFASAIRAWHLLHGFSWNINTTETKAILEGANRLAPSLSKRPKRMPFTVEILGRFRNILDLQDPCDAAVFACITTAFFCVARLGEFTVPAISRYNTTEHAPRSALSFTTNHQGLPVIKFSLPKTKTSPQGEDVMCAPMDPASPTDPKSALENHFRINPAPPDAHIFAWKHPSGIRALSKKEVTKRIDAIARLYPDLPTLKGHSLRIGGTLHYLLLGIPFDVVKTLGRWSSDTFTKYLRHHALVLAPFLQERPEIMQHLQKYILPPVR